jgi:hypothetical protein
MRAWIFAGAAVLAACGSSAAPSPVASAPAPPCEGVACDDACAGGAIGACGRAAQLYFDGKNGHPLDMKRSFDFATTACAGGDALGCVLVGSHRQDGLGAPADPTAAIAAYTKACDAGAGVGCFNLASMYSGGQGVIADLAKAADYKRRAGVAWQAACKGAEPRWCTNAAFLLAEDGQAPTPTTQRAMRALDQRACDAQFLVGCVEVARLAVDLGELAPAAYLTELERLCTAGEPSACTAAGALLLDGQRVTRDPPRGIALWLRGCVAGDKDACEGLGVEEGLGELTPRDEDAAARHLGMACDRASARACQALAKLHARTGDDVGARGFLERGCHMGDGQACAVLAAMVATGRGGPADADAALAWSRAGCSQGHGPACDRLIELGADLPVPPEFKAQLRAEACTRGVTAACAK